MLLTFTRMFQQTARRPAPSILALWNLHRQRRALESLDDDALSDIGVSRQDALAEARRAVWDAPQHWKL